MNEINDIHVNEVTRSKRLMVEEKIHVLTDNIDATIGEKLKSNLIIKIKCYISQQGWKKVF
jgi:hypothetical protein